MVQEEDPHLGTGTYSCSQMVYRESDSKWRKVVQESLEHNIAYRVGESMFAYRKRDLVISWDSYVKEEYPSCVIYTYTVSIKLRHWENAWVGEYVDSVPWSNNLHSYRLPNGRFFVRDHAGWYRSEDWTPPKVSLFDSIYEGSDANP